MLHLYFYFAPKKTRIFEARLRKNLPKSHYDVNGKVVVLSLYYHNQLKLPCDLGRFGLKRLSKFFHKNSVISFKNQKIPEFFHWGSSRVHA